MKRKVWSHPPTRPNTSPSCMLRCLHNLVMCGLMKWTNLRFAQHTWQSYHFSQWPLTIFCHDVHLNHASMFPFPMSYLFCTYYCSDTTTVALGNLNILFWRRRSLVFLKKSLRDMSGPKMSSKNVKLWEGRHPLNHHHNEWKKMIIGFHMLFIHKCT